MKPLASTIFTAVAVAAAVVSAPAASAAPPATLACATGQFCLWSDVNYTGQLATLPLDEPWQGCVSASALGLPAIRSARKNGVACQFQASLHADGACGQSTEPAFVQNETPTIDPPALSLDQFLIPC